MNASRSLKSFFALPAPLWEEAWKTAVAFLLLIAAGYSLSAVRPESFDPLLRLFTGAAASIGMYQVKGGVLMATLLSNNLLALLVAIAVGLIPLLHLSALSLGLNAMLIGALAAYYRRSGLGLAAYLAGTLPHGVTEGAALVLACAAGLYVCRATTYAALRRVDRRTVARTLGEVLRVYTHWIVPLLILSAALEAFVTPLIFGRFL